MSVHNIRGKYLPNVNCSRGGRPQLLNEEIERSCVQQVARARMNIAPHVANHAEHDFGISVSAQTMRHAFQRSVLSSQHKKKISHIFHKNVKACFDFARVHVWFSLKI